MVRPASGRRNAAQAASPRVKVTATTRTPFFMPSLILLPCRQPLYSPSTLNAATDPRRDQPGLGSAHRVVYGLAAKSALA